jgi:hypothetical protein
MTILSYDDNCLIYNSMLKHGDHNDASLLQNLRAVSNQSLVAEYYVRSAKLLQLLKNSPNFGENYWASHYQHYMEDIVDLLKTGNNDEAVTKILNMLDSIESSLGV